LLGLASIYDVGKAHILNANRWWWAYVIAQEFPGINPHDVKEWPPDDILETLARIMLVDMNRSEPIYKPK